MPRRRPKTAVSEPSETPLDFEKHGQKLTFKTFQRFAAEYPSQEGVSVYVYQVLPRINRKQAGIDTNYLAVYKEMPSEEFLTRTHGSGKYWITFTDANAPRGTTERASATVELYHPDIPNKIDPVELVLEHKESKPYLDEMRSKGIIGAAPHPAPAPAAAPQTNDYMINEKLVEHFIETTKEKKGGDRLDPIVEQILKAWIAERSKPAAGEINTELLKMLLAQKPAPADPQSDLLQTYERVDKLISKQAERSNPSSNGIWGEVVRAIPSLLQTGLEFLKFAAFQQQPSSPQQNRAPETPAAPPEAQVSEDTTMMNPTVIQRLQNVGERALKAFERGVRGDIFAASLHVDAEDERAYDMLFELGKDGILQALSSVPGIAERLKPRRAEVEKFIEQFVEYGTPDEAAVEMA